MFVGCVYLFLCVDLLLSMCVYPGLLVLCALFINVFDVLLNVVFYMCCFDAVLLSTYCHCVVNTVLLVVDLFV